MNNQTETSTSFLNILHTLGIWLTDVPKGLGSNFDSSGYYWGEEFDNIREDGVFEQGRGTSPFFCSLHNCGYQKLWLKEIYRYAFKILIPFYSFLIVH